MLGRFLAHWHGLIRPRPGLDAVLDAVERLQGYALPVSVLEAEVLPARVERYVPGDLDTLVSVGEVSWVGVEPLGERDGRVALYLTDQLPRLLRPLPPGARLDTEPLSERAQAILEVLRAQGASFFGPLQQALGGFPRETVEALWELAWKGLVTNDTFGVVRAYAGPRPDRSRARAIREGRSFRSRRTVPPTAAGRWSLLPIGRTPSLGHRVERGDGPAALARHGLVTREVAGGGLPGGFSAVRRLKSLEESGRCGAATSSPGWARCSSPCLRPGPVCSFESCPRCRR